jgi:hypothetical protein
VGRVYGRRNYIQWQAGENLMLWLNDDRGQARGTTIGTKQPVLFAASLLAFFLFPIITPRGKSRSRSHERKC